MAMGRSRRDLVLDAGANGLIYLNKSVFSFRLWQCSLAMTGVLVPPDKSMPHSTRHTDRTKTLNCDGRWSGVVDGRWMAV